MKRYDQPLSQKIVFSVVPYLRSIMHMHMHFYCYVIGGSAYLLDQESEWCSVQCN